jgi:hypothetical protein
VTLADRFAAVLVVFAGVMLAWALARRGHPAVGAACAVGALGLAALLWKCWCARPRVWLERRTDGTLCAVCSDSTTPVSVALRPQTMLLGGSVYVDFVYCVSGRQVRCRRWISRLDAPADTLRRWTVVLPRAGRVATS